jgi:putative transposase
MSSGVGASTSRSGSTARTRTATRRRPCSAGSSTAGSCDALSAAGCATSCSKARNTVGTGIVSLDLGPSTVAIVAAEAVVEADGPPRAGPVTDAVLTRFCGTLEDLSAAVRRLQRRADRQLRAANPDNYRPDGTIRKGRKSWVHSQGCRRTRGKLAEISRRESEERRCCHGELQNTILRLGCRLKAEKVSYRAWQKRFGRSIGHCAPGTFMAGVERKAGNAGGSLSPIATWKTALSQTCQCGARAKKKLSQRWHLCSCGVRAQRDLYSAYLGLHVHEDELDISRASTTWAASEPTLSKAVSERDQRASSEADGGAVGRTHVSRTARPHRRVLTGVRSIATVRRGRVGARACKRTGRSMVHAWALP